MTFSEEELKKKVFIRPFGYKKFVLSRAQKIGENLYNLSSDNYLEIKEKYGDKTNFLYKTYLFYKTIKDSTIGWWKTGKFITPEKLENERNDICSKCEHLIKDSGRCSICGCYTKYKAKFIYSKCPLNKW